MDAIHPTQFPELGFTRVTGTQVGAGTQRDISEWRFVDLTGETPALVGGQYPTRELLVADLPRYAADFGCAGATGLDALQRAYRSAMDAEREWDDELVRVYGTAASDARYDKRGIETPRLKQLHDIWRAAENARHALTETRRG